MKKSKNKVEHLLLSITNKYLYLKFFLKQKYFEDYLLHKALYYMLNIGSRVNSFSTKKMDIDERKKLFISKLLINVHQSKLLNLHRFDLFTLFKYKLICDKDKKKRLNLNRFFLLFDPTDNIVEKSIRYSFLRKKTRYFYIKRNNLLKLTNNWFYLLNNQEKKKFIKRQVNLNKLKINKKKHLLSNKDKLIYSLYYDLLKRILESFLKNEKNSIKQKVLYLNYLILFFSFFKKKTNENKLFFTYFKAKRYEEFLIQLNLNLRQKILISNNILYFLHSDCVKNKSNFINRKLFYLVNKITDYFMFNNNKIFIQRNWLKERLYIIEIINLDLDFLSLNYLNYLRSFKKFNKLQLNLFFFDALSIINRKSLNMNICIEKSELTSKQHQTYDCMLYILYFLKIKLLGSLLKKKVSLYYYNYNNIVRPFFLTNYLIILFLKNIKYITYNHMSDVVLMSILIFRSFKIKSLILDQVNFFFIKTFFFTLISFIINKFTFKKKYKLYDSYNFNVILKYSNFIIKKVKFTFLIIKLLYFNITLKLYESYNLYFFLKVNLFIIKLINVKKNVFIKLFLKEILFYVYYLTIIIIFVLMILLKTSFKFSVISLKQILLLLLILYNLIRDIFLLMYMFINISVKVILGKFHSTKPLTILLVPFQYILLYLYLNFNKSINFQLIKFNLWQYLNNLLFIFMYVNTYVFTYININNKLFKYCHKLNLINWKLIDLLKFKYKYNNIYWNGTNKIVKLNYLDLLIYKYLEKISICNNNNYSFKYCNSFFVLFQSWNFLNTNFKIKDFFWANIMYNFYMVGEIGWWLTYTTKNKFNLKKENNNCINVSFNNHWFKLNNFNKLMKNFFLKRGYTGISNLFKNNENNDLLETKQQFFNLPINSIFNYFFNNLPAQFSLEILLKRFRVSPKFFFNFMHNKYEYKDIFFLEQTKYLDDIFSEYFFSNLLFNDKPIFFDNIFYLKKKYYTLIINLQKKYSEKINTKRICYIFFKTLVKYCIFFPLKFILTVCIFYIIYTYKFVRTYNYMFIGITFYLLINYFILI